jgi:hypothetical protein
VAQDAAYIVSGMGGFELLKLIGDMVPKLAAM